MSELTSTWIGRVIDNISLDEHVGGDTNTAVYRTTISGQPAAIKLIKVDASAGRLLTHFNDAAKLSHPNLLRILRSGRTRVDDSDYVYVITEFAEENLSQVLPERSLTPQETRDVLAATLDALAYLHHQGFVHADLKPANIMAAHDQLKLSIDGVHRVGEPLSREPGAHDAPEASKALSAASDIWSLGSTLVEVLTQKLPLPPASENAAPTVPESVPAPYREIAQHCLLRTPELRWSIADISNKLKLKPAQSSASPAVMNAGRPRPAEPAVVDAGRPRPATSKRPLIFLAITAVIVGAIIAIPQLSHHEPPAPSAPTQTSAEVPPPQVTSEQQPPTPEQQTEAPKSEATAPQAASSEPDKASVPPEPKASTTASKQITDEPVEENENAPPETATPAPGVVHQVMPNVIPQARRSITGKIRVKLRVNVDQAGNVVDSQFISAGPSKYFSRVAMQAAQQWKFAPASTDARAWNIEFDFRRGGTEVHTQESR
jgi:TonB family protein